MKKPTRKQAHIKIISFFLITVLLFTVSVKVSYFTEYNQRIISYDQSQSFGILIVSLAISCYIISLVYMGLFLTKTNVFRIIKRTLIDETLEKDSSYYVQKETFDILRQESQWKDLTTGNKNLEAAENIKSNLEDGKKVYSHYKTEIVKA